MTADKILDVIAERCDAKPEELSQAWVNFAEAVANLIDHEERRLQDLGALVSAAMGLP